jgi:hypothetical protein
LCNEELYNMYYSIEFDIHVTMQCDKFLIINPTRCTNFSNLFLEWNYMFQTVPVTIIRSFSLYTQQWYMSYRFADSLQAGSECSILILLTSCQQTPDDGQRNCPKHIEFYSKNKFEKLVHLVSFIIRNSSVYIVRMIE